MTNLNKYASNNGANNGAFQEINVVYNEKSISPVFFYASQLAVKRFSSFLLAIAYSGSISITLMEQNPNKGTTQIAQSRADLFGLKGVKMELNLLQLISLDSVEDDSYILHISVNE